MIKLYLKNGIDVIISESKDARFTNCDCIGLSCKDCPFGIHCGTEFNNMTFGEAMEERKRQINNMVEYIEDTDDEVEKEQQAELKKKYTFEFTDEQAMFLHAFVNIFEHDEIEETLDVIDFVDENDPPFIRADNKRVPEGWADKDIVKIMHDISIEIYNKLHEQRGFDE